MANTDHFPGSVPNKRRDNRLAGTNFANEILEYVKNALPAPLTGNVNDVAFAPSTSLPGPQFDGQYLGSVSANQVGWTGVRAFTLPEPP
jgi:hypothetical protein